MLTAAYNSCCRLSGVTSVSALSPILLETSGEFDISGTPLLLVHGVRDEVIPLATAEDIYESAGSPKFLLEFGRAGHFEYILPSSPVYVSVVVAVAAQLAATSGGGARRPRPWSRSRPRATRSNCSPTRDLTRTRAPSRRGDPPAQRAGSTSLLRWMSAHPQLSAHRVTEIPYFIADHVHRQGWESAYRRFYDDPAPDGLLAKSVAILYSPEATQR